MGEMQWMTTRAVPERDGEWWVWLAAHPEFRPPQEAVASQGFGPGKRRLKQDPLNCRHKIGRGMANRLRAAYIRERERGLIVRDVVTCQICHAVLTAADLDNQFLDPDMYIATADTFVDPEGDDAEIVPKWKHAPHQPSRVGRPVCIQGAWMMPLPDANDLTAYGELTQKFLAALTVTDSGQTSAYPVNLFSTGGKKYDSEVVYARRGDMLGLPLLHNIGSTWALRVILGVWEITPSRFDDPKASYAPVAPPEPKLPFKQCANREGSCRHMRCIIWRERFCWRKGYAVSARPAVEIEIRRLRASGDMVAALRLEGYRVKTIARLTGVPIRTIERRIAACPLDSPLAGITANEGQLATSTVRVGL